MHVLDVFFPVLYDFFLELEHTQCLLRIRDRKMPIYRKSCNRWIFVLHVYIHIRKVSPVIRSDDQPDLSFQAAFRFLYSFQGIKYRDESTFIHRRRAVDPSLFYDSSVRIVLPFVIVFIVDVNV